MAGVRTPAVRGYEPLFLCVGAALVLYFGRALLVPLAFALTLCFLVLPTIRRLESKRVHRGVAVALVGLVTGLVLLVGAYILSRELLQLAQNLRMHRDNMHQRILALHSSAESSMEEAVGTIEELVGDKLQESELAPSGRPVPVRVVAGGSRLGFASNIILSSLQPLAELAIVIVFAMYMLMRREDLRRRLLMLAGTARLGLMTRTLDEAGTRISRYLLLQFELNAGYGLLFGVGLAVIGAPNPLLWGVVAGVLRIVPYAGTAVAMLLPLLATFAVSPNWWQPILVVVWFALLEAAVAYFIEPRILSTRTGISPLALLVSAIFWTILWGWPGLALATPMTVCVVVIGQYVPQLSFLHSLLGTNAQMSPAANFYERLLATDVPEAYAIAEKFLRTGPLLDLYDKVVLRALHMAKEDRQRGTLDEVQWDYVLLGVSEVVARLPEMRSTGGATQIRFQQLGIAPSRPSFAKEIAVICISSDDAADQLSAQMLAQVLERAKFQTLTLTSDALSDQVLKGLAQESDTVIIVSALPPFAFVQARRICQHLRQHLADNRIAVALWGSAEIQDMLLNRFGTSQPTVVVSTLAQALTQVSAWQEATRKV